MAGLLVTSVIGALACHFRNWDGLPGSTAHRQRAAERIIQQQSWHRSITVEPTNTVTAPIVESSWYLDITWICFILALWTILAGTYFTFTAQQNEHERERQAQEKRHRKSLERHKSQSTRELSRHARTLETHDTTLGQHASALDNHAVNMGQQASILGNHGVTLDRHAVTLVHHEARLNQQVNALLGQSNAIESAQDSIQELGDAVQGHAEAFNVQTQTLDAHTESLRRQSEAMESTQASIKRLADAVHGDEIGQNQGLAAEVSALASAMKTKTTDIDALKTQVSGLIETVEGSPTADGLSRKVDGLVAAIEGGKHFTEVKSDVSDLFSAVKGTDGTKGLESQVMDVQGEVEILKANTVQTAVRLDHVHADLDKKLPTHSEEAGAQRARLSELEKGTQASVDLAREVETSVKRFEGDRDDMKADLLGMQRELRALAARMDGTSRKAAEDVSQTSLRVDALAADIAQRHSIVSQDVDTQKAKLDELKGQMHESIKQVRDNADSTLEALHAQSARMDECVERIESLEASTRGSQDHQNIAQLIEAQVAAQMAEQTKRLRMEFRLRESEQGEKLNGRLDHQARLQENALNAFNLRILHIKRNQPGEVLNPRRSAPPPRAIVMNYPAIPQGPRDGSPMHGPNPFTGSPPHMNSHAGPVKSLSPVAPGFVPQSPTTAHENWLNEHERRLMGVEAVVSETARGLGRITEVVRGHDNSLRNRGAEIHHVRARLDDIDAAAFSFSTRVDTLELQAQLLRERLDGAESSSQGPAQGFVQDLAGHDIPNIGMLRFFRYIPTRHTESRPSSPQNPEQGEIGQDLPVEPRVAGEDEESDQLHSKHSTSEQTPTVVSATEPTDAENPSPSSDVEPNPRIPLTAPQGSDAPPPGTPLTGQDSEQPDSEGSTSGDNPTASSSAEPPATESPSSSSDADPNLSTASTTSGKQLDPESSTSEDTPTTESATEASNLDSPSSASNVDPNATTPSTSSRGSDPAPARNPLTPGLGSSRWTAEPEEPAQPTRPGRPSSTGNPRPNRLRRIRNERRRKGPPA